MASILQNLFVRALNPESVRSLKLVMSHASLYLGIILYTAVGAKVSSTLKRLKNASLYLGIILYTAVGAKVGSTLKLFTKNALLYLAIILYTAVGAKVGSISIFLKIIKRMPPSTSASFFILRSEQK